MGCGRGLATAANFGTVSKFSAENTDASQRYKLECKDLCEFPKTAVKLRIISCDTFSFIRLLLMSYELSFYEEKYMISLSNSSDCNCELMNLDVLLILLVLSFTCKRISAAFNQNNIGLYRIVSRLSRC